MMSYQTLGREKLVLELTARLAAFVNELTASESTAAGPTFAVDDRGAI